jgi:uncharacterized membrane protein
MERLSLEFQGARDQQLVLMVLGAICLALLATAVWHFARRRVRQGVVALSAAMGPVVAALTLGVVALVHAGQGNRRAAAGNAAAALVLAALSIAGGWLAWAAADATAFWMSLAGLQTALAVGVFYASVYGYLGPWRLVTLMVLRSLAILALLLVLFKPALAITRVDDGKPPLPILVDRSASMSTIDETSGGDRFAQSIAMLNTQRMRGEFAAMRPAWHGFGASPVLAANFDELAAMKPSGPGADATDLAAAIRQAAGNFSGAPGIVLVSDGLHNVANADPVDATVEAGVPIYVLGVGAASESLTARRNVRAISAAAPLEAVKNNVTSITLQLGLTAMQGVAVSEAQLFEEGIDQPVATAAVPPPGKNDQTVSVELKWTPRGSPAGPDAPMPELRRLRIVVPPAAGESITDDNELALHALVTEPRIRLLYVEGSMRPEYKFLKRLLDSDPNVQFMGLVRVSGNKFSAQGGIGGKTLDHLPATEAEMAMFDVIILGDLDSTFLTREQLGRLKAFVDKGGGLMMLGGHNSFGPGGYGDTELQAVLPVVVGPRAGGQDSTPFVPQLTALGESHAIMAGIAGFFGGPGGRTPKADLPKLPELSGCVTVVREKPGAAVLAVHPTRKNESGPLIVLAAQQFGAGRSVAFTGDTTWNWSMPLRGLGQDSPYSRFWGQTIRWLANTQTKTRDAQPQVVLRLDRAYTQVGQPVGLTAFVRDAKTPPAGIHVEATITCDDTAVGPQTLPLSAGKESGSFAATWQAAKPGKYRLKAAATGPDGKPIGSDELTVRVAPHSSELDKLARNSRLLEQIAERSGGAYRDLLAMPELIDQIASRQKALAPPQPQGRSLPLYSFTWLFLAFAALLTAEWLLRRNWQLH